MKTHNTNNDGLTDEQRQQQKIIQEEMMLRFALPPNWVPYTDPNTGSVYYYNVVTGASQWERPVYSEAEYSKLKAEKERAEEEAAAAEEAAKQPIQTKTSENTQNNTQKHALTRAEKQREREKEAEEYQRLLEESRKRAKEEAEQMKESTPFGQWEVKTDPSQILQRSDELKKQDEIKAKRERCGRIYFIFFFVF